MSVLFVVYERQNEKERNFKFKIDRTKAVIWIELNFAIWIFYDHHHDVW